MRAIKIGIDRTTLAGVKVWHDKICNPIVTSKEIKLVSLLDAFKAALGALGEIVKIQ